MSKRTPGPWRNVPAGPRMRDKYTQPFAVANPSIPTIICGCFGDVSGGVEAAEANAALIAAAPDLLAALQRGETELSRWHQWRLSTNDMYAGSDGYLETQAVIDSMRAALKLATAGRMK